ncbi:MAG: AIR synthase-related protein, partial [Prochlorotrichaceae cyanobacterium]
QLHKTVAGQPPIVDYRLEKQVQSACRHGIRQGWVRSAHDCAEGGFAIALAEACLAGDKGALLSLPEIPADLRWDWVLFAEGGARIVVSVSRQNQALWETFLQSELPGAWSRLGQVTLAKSGLTLNTAIGQKILTATLDEMSDSFDQAIDRAMATC